MKREIIRVEPLSTYLERWTASTSAGTRHGDTVYVSGFPPSIQPPARSVDKCAAVNAIYTCYFPQHPPARIFVNVPAWRGHFDIEIDCITAVK
jgi:2-iminobutanoate/2-iminopropanoate deaminase